MSNVIAALAGTILGFAGGVFATIYSQWRQSKREKYKELRSNLSMVVSESRAFAMQLHSQLAVFAGQSVSDYMDVVKESTFFPMEKIMGTIHLYFPQIFAEADMFHEAVIACIRSANNLAKADLEKKIAKADLEKEEDAQVLVKDLENVWQEKMRDMLKARYQFEKAASKLMADLLDEKSPSKGKIRLWLKRRFARCK